MRKDEFITVEVFRGRSDRKCQSAYALQRELQTRTRVRVKNAPLAVPCGTDVLSRWEYLPIGDDEHLYVDRSTIEYVTAEEYSQSNIPEIGHAYSIRDV